MLVIAAVAVALGTVAGFGRAGLAVPLTIAAGGAVCVLAATWRRERIAIVAALVCVACAAGASAAWRGAGSAHALLPSLASEHAHVRVCGEISLVGERASVATVTEVMRGDTSWSTREPVVVIGRSAHALPPGEHLCATGALKLAKDGAAMITVSRVGDRRPGSRLRVAAASVRAAYAKTAAAALPKTEAGLLLGMTDGDTDLLGDDVIEEFRTTGLAHLVAVSGENVAVLLALVVVLSRLLVRRGRWLRAAVALPPLVFFAFLTGLQASVMRAVITAGIGLAVTAGGRATDAMRLTLCSFIVLVLAAPDTLFSPGFQLSFAATFGLIVWSEPIGRHMRWLGDGVVARTIIVAASATIAAQAAVAPLLAWRFGRIPALGGLANLLCVPVAGFITVGGLITLSAASIVRPLGFLPATLRLPLDLILLCARWFARLPFASVGASVLIGAAVTATLGALLATTSRIRTGAIAFAVVCVTAATGQGLAADTCDAPSVVALDVGQGSAVLLRAGDHAVLVDAGPERADVSGQLAATHTNRLDAIVITHPHIDHELGALQLFGHLDVDALYGPPELVWSSGATVIAAAKKHGIGFSALVAGDRVDAGPISLDVLWPQPHEVGRPDPDLVDVNSLVLRAHLGSTDVVLPGDIRSEQQRQVARDAADAAILIAPHHGSKDLDPGFVDAVDPKITLITVGRPNMYGLPAPESVRRYAARSTVGRTDDDGRVTVCLTEDGAEVTTER